MKQSKTQTVIEFDVTNVKTKPWGRRLEDQRKNKVRNGKIQKNKQPQLYKAKEAKAKKRYEVPKETLDKYSRGDGVNLSKVHTKIHRKKFEEKEKNIKFATELSAKTEVYYCVLGPIINK